MEKNPAQLKMQWVVLLILLIVLAMIVYGICVNTYGYDTHRILAGAETKDQNLHIVTRMDDVQRKFYILDEVLQQYYAADILSKFLVNEYEFVTLNEFVRLRKYHIPGYSRDSSDSLDKSREPDGSDEIAGYKILPVPMGFQLSALGNYYYSSYEIRDALPKDANVMLIKPIGPWEIQKSGELLLYFDLEQLLHERGNTTHSIFRYFDWNTGTKYNSASSSAYSHAVINNNDPHFPIPCLFPNKQDVEKKQQKPDAVIIEKFSMQDKSCCTSELATLPQDLYNFCLALQHLRVGGDLYVKLKYLVYLPSLQLLSYVNRMFTSVRYIHNKLVQNKVDDDYLHFIGLRMDAATQQIQDLQNICESYDHEIGLQTYVSADVTNAYFCNFVASDAGDSNNVKAVIADFGPQLKVDVSTELLELLQDVYQQKRKYVKSALRKIQSLQDLFSGGSEKHIDRLINNQISTAVSWCESNGLQINEIYHKPKIRSYHKIVRKYFKQEPGVNLNRIALTNDSVYSITNWYFADQMSRMLLDVLRGLDTSNHSDSKNQKYTIVDATANIGGNTISFAKHFHTVKSVEINERTAKCLQNNVDVYGLHNVEVIHADFTKLDLSADVIFMDPPWSGAFYKTRADIDMYLSDVNILDIIPKLRCRVFAMKAPCNYNIAGLLRVLQHVQLHQLGNMMFVISVNN